MRDDHLCLAGIFSRHLKNEDVLNEGLALGLFPIDVLMLLLTFYHAHYVRTL